MDVILDQKNAGHSDFKVKELCDSIGKYFSLIFLELLKKLLCAVRMGVS